MNIQDKINKPPSKNDAESENFYRTIFQNAGIATVIFKKDTTILIVNSEFEKLTGYACEEVEGRKKLSEFISGEEDLYEHYCRSIKRKSDRASNTYEFQLVHRSEKVKDIVATITAIPGTKKTLMTLLDITERKRMEAALKESRTQLAHIINFLPDPTYAIDLSGKVIAWNHAIEEMTGIRAENMLGKGDHEYIIPFYGMARPVLTDLVFESNEELEKKYDFVKREGDVLLAEAEVPVRGKPHILWGKAGPLYDGNGNVIGAIESVRDITVLKLAEKALQKAHDDLEIRVRERTKELELANEALRKEIFERKHAEEVLKQSEEKYNHFFKTSRDCVFITSNDGKVIDFNDAAMELFGHCNREELFKVRVQDLYANPEERVRHLSIIKKNGYAEEFPIAIRRKDGSVRYTLITSVARFDDKGNPVGAQGTIRDITERKLAEEALRSSEEKYRQIFECATEGIYQSTPDGIYLSINPAFARMHGYASSQEMIDFVTNIGEQHYVDPKAREKLVKLLYEHDSVEGYEVEIFRKDRSKFWISINSHTVRDAWGNVLYFEGTNVDITERKNAEAALRESQEYTKILFNSSIVPQIVMDANSGIFIDCNEAAVKICGFDGREELIGKTPLDVSVPLQYNGRNSEIEAQKCVQICINNGAHVFEWCFQRPNGEIWDAEVNLMLFQHKGKPFMQFTLQDITARIKAEEALIRSEYLYRAIFENTGVANMLVREDTVIILANSEFEKLSGFLKDDIEGKKSWTELFVEEDLNRMLQYHHLRRKDKKDVLSKYECRLRDRYGNIKDIALSVDMIPSTKESIVSLHDITERKQAERTLKESQRRLADIIEFLPDATLVIDKEGKVIAWNRAMEIMTGVKKEDMLGKGNHEYSLPFYGDRRNILVDLVLHPDKQTKNNYMAIQRVGDILLGEALTQNLLIGNIHISGTASVLRDNSGEVIAAIECIRDNTERKKLAERLNRAEKMEALGTLAGGVAHDLNNVLGVLVGYSELLAESLPEDSFERNYAENIQKSSEKGAAIIQDLLTLARRGVAVSETINLNHLVYDYFKTPEYEKLISYHMDVKIRTKYEKKLMLIKGSPIHLGKTIMNLVSNALEAISGYGEVTIKTANYYLDHPVRGYDAIQEGDYVVLAVSDTGRGISANDLGKIFEPFYTKKVMGRSGTGLGLAVVWGTVKDHNGYIDVQSEEGKGSTFTLYFPATREELEKNEEALSTLSYTGNGESILVVDDVPEQRELAIKMLSKLGYKVESVASGEEALDYLKTNEVDLLVLDMIMYPGMDGMETYRKILEINPKQKAVIVSGFSETDRVKKTQGMGAGAFVRKPYILEKIGYAIKKVLGQQQNEL